MRLVLHPPGLIRLFTKQEEKGETKRPAEIDPDAYEVTPYGRRPRKTIKRRLKTTAMITAVGAAAAAAAVWLFV